MTKGLPLRVLRKASCKTSTISAANLTSQGRRKRPHKPTTAISTSVPNPISWPPPKPWISRKWLHLSWTFWELIVLICSVTWVLGPFIFRKDILQKLMDSNFYEWQLHPRKTVSSDLHWRRIRMHTILSSVTNLELSFSPTSQSILAILSIGEIFILATRHCPIGVDVNQRFRWSSAVATCPSLRPLPRPGKFDTFQVNLRFSYLLPADAIIGTVNMSRARCTAKLLNTLQRRNSARHIIVACWQTSLSLVEPSFWRYMGSRKINL